MRWPQCQLTHGVTDLFYSCNASGSYGRQARQSGKILVVMIDFKFSTVGLQQLCWNKFYHDAGILQEKPARNWVFQKAD